MALISDASDHSLQHPLRVTTVEVQSGPATDPLAWLAVASDDDEAWFWEVPDDDTSWTGLASAVVVHVDELEIAAGPAT